MPNRFLQPVQGEYVPQYTPDLIDKEVAFAAAANKQKRYDDTLAKAQENFINIDYINKGGRGEIANELQKYYSGKQDEIIQDILYNKDPKAATEKLLTLYQEYNNDEDIKQLRQESQEYAKTMKNIGTGKDSATVSALMRSYDNKWENSPYLNEETGEYSEMPSQPFGDIVDISNLITKIQTLISTQRLPLIPEISELYNNVHYDSNSGQFMGYNLKTGHMDTIDGDLVHKSLKQYIGNLPEFLSSVDVIEDLWGKGSAEKLLDNITSAAGSMKNMQQVNTQNQFIPASDITSEENYVSPAAKVQAVMNKEQIQSVVSNAKGTSNPKDLESKLDLTKNLLVNTISEEEKNSTYYGNSDKPEDIVVRGQQLLELARTTLGSQNTIEDPINPLISNSDYYNNIQLTTGDIPPEAFQEIIPDMETAIEMHKTIKERDPNAPTPFREYYSNQGLIQPMDESMFLEQSEMEQLKEMWGENSNEYQNLKESQIALQKRNAEVLIYNNEKRHQNELKFDSYNGILSPEQLMNSELVNKYIKDGNIPKAIEQLKKVADIPKNLEQELLNIDKKIPFNKTVNYNGNIDINYSTSLYTQNYLKKLDSDFIKENSNLSGLPLYSLASIYEKTIKEEGEFNIEKFKNNLDSYYNSINAVGKTEYFRQKKEDYKKKLQTFYNTGGITKLEHLMNSEEVKQAKEAEKLDYIKGRLRFVYKNKKDSFIAAQSIAEDKYQQALKDEMRQKFSNYTLENWSRREPATTDTKKFWAEAGVMNIYDITDRLKERLKDPTLAAQFLQGGRVFDVSNGVEITNDIMMEEGLRSLVTEDFRDSDDIGLYSIDNYSFDLMGSQVLDIGPVVFLNVQKKVDQTDKNSANQSYVIAVTGPEISEMANQKQIYRAYMEGREGMLDADTRKKSEKIQAEIFDLLEKSNTNTIHSYPSGIANGTFYYTDIVPTKGSNGLRFDIKTFYYKDNKKVYAYSDSNVDPVYLATTIAGLIKDSTPTK